MRRLLMILAAVFLVASCAKDDTTYQKQVESIKKYVDAQLVVQDYLIVTKFGDITRITVPNVIVFQPEKEGEEPITVVEKLEGEQAGENALIKMTYSGYVFTSNPSSLFATNDINVANQHGWDTTDEENFEPIVIDLSDKTILEGLRKGLVGVRRGEKCVVIFPSRYGMGEKPNGMIPAGSALAFDVQVIDIEN